MKKNQLINGLEGDLRNLVNEASSLEAYDIPEGKINYILEVCNKGLDAINDYYLVSDRIKVSKLEVYEKYGLPNLFNANKKTLAEGYKKAIEILQNIEKGKKMQ